jgi:hypothetical protein
VLAEHPRSYDKGQQIEQEAHIQELVARKRQARQHRGQDRLTQAVRSAQALLMQAAQRGYVLGSITTQLLQLLDRYGATELEIAVQEALSRDVPHPNAVRLSLEKHREEKNQLPPVNIVLPDDERVRALVIQPHNLNDYDQLHLSAEEKNNDN